MVGEACPCEGGGPAIHDFSYCVNKDVGGRPSPAMTIGVDSPLSSELLNHMVI
jgi:hypothetical protein